MTMPLADFAKCSISGIWKDPEETMTFVTKLNLFDFATNLSNFFFLKCKIIKSSMGYNTFSRVIICSYWKITFVQLPWTIIEAKVSLRITQEKLTRIESGFHCVKSVHIRSYSGPHFPTIGLNTRKYGPEHGNFSCSVQFNFWICFFSLHSLLDSAFLLQTIWKITCICKYSTYITCCL